MLKIPALPDEYCPKCKNANHGETVAGCSVWRVSTNRGLLYECDQCAFTWRIRDGVAVPSAV